MSDAREPSSLEDIQSALTGGVPMGRWKEGLLFKGINPTPGLKSAANWFPRTEKLGPGEMWIIFMGTAPFIGPGQMNTSVFVQLGNGENFIFDLGEGSIANCIPGDFSLSELDKVFITHLHIDPSCHCRISTCLEVGRVGGTSRYVFLAPPVALSRVAHILLVPVDVLMSRWMLLGIKRHAEIVVVR